jgi:hypothetical protein
LIDSDLDGYIGVRDLKVAIQRYYFIEEEEFGPDKGCTWETPEEKEMVAER